MIDILFLLIIFFMVGTNFGMPEGHLALDLPRAASSNSANGANDKKVVEVLENGAIYLDGQRMSSNQLTQYLAGLNRQKPGLAVVVRSEKNARADVFTEALSAVSSAGIQRVSMTTANVPNSNR